MIRGMPDDRQVKRRSWPCPPASWSARLSTKMAWYSGVSGACWPRLRGLLGSHWVPPTRCHWPDKSGYFASSKAWAVAALMLRIAASTIGAATLPENMIVPPCDWPPDPCGAWVRHAPLKRQLCNKLHQAPMHAKGQRHWTGCTAGAHMIALATDYPQRGSVL